MVGQVLRVRWLALLLIALTAFVVAACAAQPPASPTRVAHPTTLEGTTWRLVSIGGRPPPVGAAATLDFGPGLVSGDSGCNSFGGAFTYDRSSGALRIGDLVSTKRACVEPARNDLEAAFFQALSGVAAANVDPDGLLVLSGSGAELVLAVGPQEIGLPSDAAGSLVP